MINKDKSNHYKNLRRLFLEQMVKIPEPLELDSTHYRLPENPGVIYTRSPHLLVLVLTESQAEFHKFLIANKLPRHDYKYLSQPEQVLGRSWNDTYLLRVGNWQRSRFFDDDYSYSHQLLDARFPG